MTDSALGGRVALITGSGKDLGFAMARGLAAAGARVVLNGRHEQALNQAAAELHSAGYEATTSAFDVTDLDAAAQAIAAIEAEQGRLDILINNVGYRDRRSLFEFEPGAMDKMLQANLTAPFELSRLAARGMMARKWGRIINISSVVAQIAGAGDTTYTAVKGGLESLTRVLAAELGHAGITVNAIAPGFFATSANAERLRDASVSDWLQQRTALGRWAQAEEISGPAVFLASDAASYVTGQVLAVDGGMLGHL